MSEPPEPNVIWELACWAVVLACIGFVLYIVMINWEMLWEIALEYWDIIGLILQQ